MSTHERPRERTWLVGPPDAPRWQFKLAALVWRCTRGSGIPYLGHVPGTHRAARWAFTTIVLEREYVEITKTQSQTGGADR